MAIRGLQGKKTGLSKEYTVIHFGDGTSNNGKTTFPIFIKILKSQLALLGGSSKFGKVEGTYASPAGLTHKYHRDANGVVWRNVNGTKGGVLYDNTSPVNPVVNGNKVVLTLYKTRKRAGTLGKGTEQINNTVTFHVPVTVNASQVGTWVTENFGEKSPILKEWKFGKATVFVGNTKPTAKGKSSNSLIDAKQYLLPMGTIETGKSTAKTGAVQASSKSSTVAYAVLRSAALEQFGFKTIESNSLSEIAKGTTLPGKAGSSSGGKASRYNVFKQAKVYGQVWTETSTANTVTQTPVSNVGTSVTVKCRFTNRLNSKTIATRSIKSNTSYAYFHCAAGTPVGLILESLTTFPRRPRSFQIATGSSKQYGNTIEVPQKSGATRA
jgi:hypothetical protein